MYELYCWNGMVLHATASSVCARKDANCGFLGAECRAHSGLWMRRVQARYIAIAKLGPLINIQWVLDNSISGNSVSALLGQKWVAQKTAIQNRHDNLVSR
jgi:hypothetical protein